MLPRGWALPPQRWILAGLRGEDRAPPQRRRVEAVNHVRPRDGKFVPGHQNDRLGERGTPDARTGRHLSSPFLLLWCVQSLTSMPRAGRSEDKDQMKRLLLGILLSLPAMPQSLVFKNFTLIDGRGGNPVSNAAMIVESGRITWVGPASQLKAPDGASINDVSGKYLMPGIINLHGHVSVASGLTQDPKRFYTRELVEKNLHIYASYGVTSVASLGTDQPLVYQIREEQRRGHPSVARIFTSGRGFTCKGGYPSTVAGMAGVPYEVATAQQATADVEELAAHSPDLVKIWVDDHLGTVPK